MDGPDRLLLVAVDMGYGSRDALAHVGVEDPLPRQVLHGSALPEGAGQADVRPFQQGRLPRLVKGQQSPHLGVEPFVGERVRRQLVPQEATDHFFREDNWIQRHFLLPFRNRCDRFINCNF